MAANQELQVQNKRQVEGVLINFHEIYSFQINA